MYLTLDKLCFVIIITLVFGCKSNQGLKSCNGNMIAFDEDLQFILNDCISLESISPGTSKYGDYTFFRFACNENGTDSFPIIEVLSFDIEDRNTIVTSNINMGFINASGSYTEDQILDYAQGRLKEIFSCHLDLDSYLNKIGHLSKEDSLSYKYKGILFEIKWEDTDILVFNMQKI